MNGKVQKKGSKQLVIFLLCMLLMIPATSGVYADSGTYTVKGYMYYQGAYCALQSKDVSLTRQELGQISSREAFQRKVAEKSQILIIDQRKNRVLKQVDQVQVQDYSYSQIKSYSNSTSSAYNRYITVGVNNNKYSTKSITLNVAIGASQSKQKAPASPGTTTTKKPAPAGKGTSNKTKQPGPQKTKTPKKKNNQGDKANKISDTIGKSSKSSNNNDENMLSSDSDATMPIFKPYGQLGYTAITKEFNASSFIASVAPIYADNSFLQEEDESASTWINGNVLWLVLFHVAALTLFYLVFKRKKIFNWLKERVQR